MVAEDRKYKHIVKPLLASLVCAQYVQIIVKFEVVFKGNNWCFHFCQLNVSWHLDVEKYFLMSDVANH